MLDPGCRSGSAISPSPARGPDPIQRRSLQIFVRLTAIVFSCPDSSTSPSRAPCASKWSVGLGQLQTGPPVQLGDHRRREPGRRVDPGADRRPAQRQLGHPGQRRADPLGAAPDLLRVAVELLAERHRRRVHQVCAPGLHHLGELGSLTATGIPPGAPAPAADPGRRPRWRRRGSPTGRCRCWTGDALTWSFGCTSVPSARVASVASTSLAFMLVDVPEPVWKTSIGNSASNSPAATSSAAATIASAVSRVEHAELGVHHRGRGLDRASAWIERRRQRPAGDREVLHRALGLRPPQRVREAP